MIGCFSGDPGQVLESAHFALEPIEVAHADLLFDHLQDPRLYTFVPGDPPATRDALRATYERWSARRDPDGTAVWCNYALRSLVQRAYVGTLQATVTNASDALVAYQVFPPRWRSGIARECLVAMLDALSTWGVRRFVAHVDTRNVASRCLLDSLGFLLVRRIDDADFFKGTSSHEFVYERCPRGGFTQYHGRTSAGGSGDGQPARG